MTTIATIFGSFCLLSAAFQFAFISLRRRPSIEVPDRNGQVIPVAEDSLPYLLEAALRVADPESQRRTGTSYNTITA